MLSRLTSLVYTRRSIKEQMDELKDTIAEIDSQILELLDEGEGFDDDVIRVTVHARTTLDKKRAETLLADINLPEEVVKKIWVPTIDTRALKEYAPEVYAEASSQSAPFITMKELT